MMVKKAVDKAEYLAATSCIVNRDDPRYTRILWVLDHPDWKSLPYEIRAARDIMIALDDTEETNALMLDISVFCLS